MCLTCISLLVHSQVYSVIKHLLDKLALVGIINVDPKVQAQELTQSVGEEITRMIGQQKELERRFEELVSAQHTLRQLPNKAKLRENQVELQQVAEALRQSTKTLCRHVPNASTHSAPQELLMQKGLCGFWGGGQWRVFLLFVAIHQFISAWA